MKLLPLNSCYLLYIHLLLHSLENSVNLLFFVAEERVEPPVVVRVVRVIEHKLQIRDQILIMSKRVVTFYI